MDSMHLSSSVEAVIDSVRRHHHGNPEFMQDWMTEEERIAAERKGRGRGGGRGGADRC
jgi:hypothetical protein